MLKKRVKVMKRPRRVSSKRTRSIINSPKKRKISKKANLRRRSITP